MRASVLFLSPLLLLLARKIHSESNDEVPLIPRELLFGNPERTYVGISPDGKWLSYCAPLNGVLNIAVQEILPDGRLDKTVEFYTNDTGRGVHSYSWTYLPNTFIFSQDQDGDENWKIYKVNVETKEEVVLSDTHGVKAKVFKVAHTHPNKIMIGLNDRDRVYHDVYEIDLETGERNLVYQNEEFESIEFDHDLNIRYATKNDDDANKIYMVPVRNLSGLISSWKMYLNLTLEESYGRYMSEFTADNRFVYWYGRGDEDLPLIVKKDFDKPNEEGELIYAPKEAEVAGIFYHPTKYTVITVSESYGKTQRYILDKSYKRDFDYLYRKLNVSHVSIGTSVDMKIWLVKRSTSDAPSKYYLYHRDSQKITYLFTSQQELEKYKFAEMKPIEIKTSDELTEVCYFTQPVGKETKRNPLVLIVHGGPWSRDHWEFRVETQWMANRGFAVLQCNFRVSTGYGRKHFVAGFGEWARKMHQDLIDGVNDVIAKGWVDPERVAIYGSSYGGYAALVGLTFTPKTFACGVSEVGMSNVVSLINTMPPYWLPARNRLIKQIGGSPDTEEGRAYLESRSPLFLTGNIERPLFIAHGANDPRVKKAEADQIVAKMKELNIPVTYLVAWNEGHGFARPENNMVQYERVEEFLHHCLGGRTPQPIDPENLAKANITIDPPTTMIQIIILNRHRV